MGVALVKHGSDDSDPRSGLREAIAARAVAHAKAELQQQAIDRARNMVREAEARLNVAGEALEATRALRASSLVESAQTGAAPQANTALRAARQALADSEDEASAVRSALERVEANSGDFGDEVSAADNAVLVAVAEVVRPVGDELLAKAKRLRIELACTLNVLAELSREEFANDARDRQLDVPVFSNIYKDGAARDARNGPLRALRAAIEEFNTLAAQDEVKKAAKQATDVYVRWRAALRNDPDAGLPS
jgi:hypothetical protein